MKKLVITSIFALLFAGSGVIMAQAPAAAYLGLPGDNLNLFAVMNLFQESETLEGFERSLNDPESMINNLDLNGDGYVDYIIVTDHVNGNVHTIVLSVALNKREYQDVAVFAVEKFRDGSVQIQLIGDEALYGKNYIIEPIYAETPNPGYTGKRGTPARVVTTTYYEVATWPVIRYIYSPVYTVWRPAWRWGYYPVYWQPYQAHYWHYYHGYHYRLHNHYITYYRPWHHHRVNVYHHTYYTGIRRHSPTVIVMINRGHYKSTYNKPEKKRDGEAHFERVYAQNSGRGSTVRQPTPAAGNARVSQERREAARQTAPATGSTVRTTESRSRTTPASVQREQTESRTRTQPARVQENRTESRSRTTPASVQREQTESRTRTQPARVQENRTESRSRTTPASVQREQTESRSNSRATKVQSSRPESRTRTQPARVTETRRQTPPVKAQQSRTESRSRTTPASVQREQTESRSNSRATKETRSENRRK
jgi:hypothetical protein